MRQNIILSLEKSRLTLIAPIVTWNEPKPIEYGTPLTTTQLNATASVEGKFSYQPDSGDVLAVGRYRLNVSFVPTDTEKYGSVEKFVYLAVDPPKPRSTPPPPVVTTKPAKTPPYFILTGISISAPKPATPEDPMMLSTFHLRLQNAGESASHGMELKIALISYEGNAGIPITAQLSSPTTDIEPGGIVDFASNAVPIRAGRSNDLIRVRLRYKNLNRPDDTIPYQDIYRRWAGNRSGIPSLSFMEIDEETDKYIKEYFDKNVPTQR
jgi:hypothetical protein